MELLSPLHPRFIHFPVAFLFTGSLLALAYMLRWPRPSLATLTWGMILIGWVTLFAAVVTGLIDREAAPRTGEVSTVISLHTAMGFALIGVYGLMLYERLKSVAAMDTPGVRPRLSALAALGLVLLVVDGWLGGSLVYTYGLGVSP